MRGLHAAAFLGAIVMRGRAFPNGMGFRRSVVMATTSPNSEWTPPEIKLLGTRPDAVLARLLGRTAEGVSLKRQKLKIKAPVQPGWTEDEMKLLGRLPDAEVARRVKRSETAVQIKRLQLGINRQRKAAKRPLGPEMVKLLFGPYHPPPVRRDKELVCAIRGKVEAGDYSNGLIPWPMRWGTRSLILCHDLVRAVRKESAMAVAHYWGVCSAIVSRWRKALAVEPITPGTRRLISFVHSEAMTPALRAHLSRVKTGKPMKMTKLGMARLMAALHRPKSAQWHRSMARHFAARRGKPVNPADRAWSAAEESLVGTRPDREVARLLKRSVVAVAARRKLKAIPYQNPAFHGWSTQELALLGQLPDDEVVARTGHPLKSVQIKRQALGMLVRPHPAPWTATEDRLLGTIADTLLAAQLGRSRSQVRLRRIALSIAPAVERVAHRDWTPQEDRFLGTASDAKVGRMLGRTMVSVQLRRLGLGLLSHREKRFRRKHDR